MSSNNKAYASPSESMSLNNSFTESNDIQTSFNENISQRHPDIAYNGSIEADEDYADYIVSSVKAVVLG